MQVQRTSRHGATFGSKKIGHLQLPEGLTCNNPNRLLADQEEGGQLCKHAGRKSTCGPVVHFQKMQATRMFTADMQMMTSKQTPSWLSP